MTSNIKLSRQFENRFINELGETVFDGDKIYELLYQGKHINYEVTDSNDIDLYNQIMEKYGLIDKKIETYTYTTKDFDDFHSERQQEWSMPIGYLNIDLLEYFSNKNLTDIEMERVSVELSYFEKYNCSDVLRFLIYLVDVMRKHKIVWGVGRGSSVSSFCLYLIGIHKINSIKYGLELEEFFKEK